MGIDALKQTLPPPQEPVIRSYDMVNPSPGTQIEIQPRPDFTPAQSVSLEVMKTLASKYPEMEVLHGGYTIGADHHVAVDSYCI